MNPSEWRSFFHDRGVSADLASSYLAYIKPLFKNNQPIIFEFEHLSLLLGINSEYLARMVASSEKFYREFYILKRNGSKRRILAPYQSMLLAQRWILQNVLANIEIHPAAHGFCRNRSIKTNAEPHIGSKTLLKMDLEDFFPSISMSWIINVFSDAGYSPNVSYYLASLCCHKGVLAQGAATSPALSNIVLRSLDKRLERLATKCSLKYTRYADDMTFSGEKIHSSFSWLVAKIIGQYGLAVNEEKTRLKVEGGARIVTGISIGKERLSIPNKYKRALKNEIFFIKKFGLLSHMSNKKIRNPNYIQTLLGRISFWLYVEPDDQYALSARKLLFEAMNS